jgi:hypothetical protein
MTFRRLRGEFARKEDARDEGELIVFGTWAAQMDCRWSAHAGWHHPLPVLVAKRGNGEWTGVAHDGSLRGLTPLRFSQAIATSLTGAFLLFLGIDLLVEEVSGMSLGLVRRQCRSFRVRS